MTKADVPRYQFKSDPYSSHTVMLRWLGDGFGRLLLDIGAADGVLSRRLTGAGWRVVGIERDPSLARAGAAYCERMIVANLDHEIPELDASFDVILYGDVLEHLAEPRRVLIELNRFLAPDGVVLVSVPNVAHFVIRLSLLAGRFDYVDRGILDETHLRFFTDRSLRRLITDVGLSIDRFTATPAPLYQILPQRLHRPWLAATHALNASIANTFPRLMGYQFIVRAFRKEPAVALKSN